MVGRMPTLTEDDRELPTIDEQLDANIKQYRLFKMWTQQSSVQKTLGDEFKRTGEYAESQPQPNMQRGQASRGPWFALLGVMAFVMLSSTWSAVPRTTNAGFEHIITREPLTTEIEATSSPTTPSLTVVIIEESPLREGGEEPLPTEPLPTDPLPAEPDAVIPQEEPNEDIVEEQPVEATARPTIALSPHDVVALEKRNRFLPRTWDEVQYNAFPPEDDLFLYSPNGGFANQIYELAASMNFARVSGRRLVLPLIGSHTSGPAAYNRLGHRNLFQIDRLLDLPHLNRFFGNHTTPSVVVLNMTVMNFVRKLPDTSSAAYVFISAGTKFQKSGVLAVRALNTYLKSRQYVHFGGPKYYGRWFTYHPMTEARMQLRAAPRIREFAVRIVNETFGGQPFNALHIRLGDYHYLADPATVWLEKMQEKGGFDRNLPLYISTDATEELKLTFFQPIEALYNVTYRSDLAPAEEINAYMKMFPEESAMDFFGIVEQLICAQSVNFLPSYYSTFSDAIVFTRLHRLKMFPETFKRNTTATAAPTGDSA